MEPNSRKTSETSQRKVSSSDPFEDMPIVWVMGKYIKISGITVYESKYMIAIFLNNLKSILEIYLRWARFWT